jgi:CheY-like chemotaxis protein
LVANGFAALRAVSDIKPNLFLLDYQLPRMNGIELYDQLHAQKGLEDVPAIMMSASLPKHAIGKRQIINIDKPIELEALLHAIQSLLG